MDRKLEPIKADIEKVHPGQGCHMETTLHSHSHSLRFTCMSFGLWKEAGSSTQKGPNPDPCCCDPTVLITAT